MYVYIQSLKYVTSTPRCKRMAQNTNIKKKCHTINSKHWMADDRMRKRTNQSLVYIIIIIMTRWYTQFQCQFLSVYWFAQSLKSYIKDLDMLLMNSWKTDCAVRISFKFSKIVFGIFVIRLEDVLIELSIENNCDGNLVVKKIVKILLKSIKKNFNRSSVFLVTY